ncbi:MAG: hypothetical protein HY784_10880 [Chloroflexi bacterium]|nr:hypothetical protein [Chloroflexota bacterium]
MAKKIQAWSTYGPRLEPASPMTSEELIENIVAATNQSRGSVLAVLSELDEQIEAGLKAGRAAKKRAPRPPRRPATPAPNCRRNRRPCTRITRMPSEASVESARSVQSVYENRMPPEASVESVQSVQSVYEEPSRPALRSSSSRLWTFQPARSSRSSIFWRARASEAPDGRPSVEEELETIERSTPVLYDLLVAGLNKLRRR